MSWKTNIGVARVLADGRGPKGSSQPGSKMIIRTKVPKVIVPDQVILNVGGCTLLQVADKKHRGTHKKGLAVGSAGLNEHHVHGLVEQYDVVYDSGVWHDNFMRHAAGQGKPWNGVFKGTVFVSTLIQMKKYEERIKALGGTVDNKAGLSTNVNVLVSADPSIGDNVTKKTYAAIIRDIVIINGKQFEAALNKAEEA